MIRVFFGTEADDEGASCVVNTITGKHHATSIPEMKSWGLDLNKTMAEHVFKTLDTNLQLGPKILEGIRVMLSYSMDPNLSWEGQTLLDRAVNLGELELAENLRDNNATMTANPNAVASLVDKTGVNTVALKKILALQCNDKTKDCPYTEFHPETGLPQSQAARQIANKMKVFSLLVEHNYDFKQCDATGETLLTQLANFLNAKLPNRHAHSSVTNNYDKMFYDNFVKKYLSPKLLREIEKRAEQPESIESETLTCRYNRVARQNELRNSFFIGVGAILFAAAAFIFRRQIAQIPVLCVRGYRAALVAKPRREVSAVPVTQTPERSHVEVHADVTHSDSASHQHKHYKHKSKQYVTDRARLDELELIEVKMRELEDKRREEEKAVRDKEAAAKAAEALEDAKKADAARHAAQQKQRKLLAEQAAAIGAELEAKIILSSIIHTEKAMSARVLEMQRRESLRQLAEQAAGFASRQPPDRKSVMQLEKDLDARASIARLRDRQQQQRREQAERQVMECVATLRVEKAKTTFMKRMQKAKFSLFDASLGASRNPDSKATAIQRVAAIAGSVPVFSIAGVSIWNPPRLPIGTQSSSHALLKTPAASANDAAAAPSQYAKKK